MGSRVYDNDTSISTVTDSRVGVADNAVLLQGGSTLTQTNNTTTTTYSADGAALTAMSSDLRAATATLSGDANATQRALINANADTTAEFMRTQATINRDSLGAVERAARAANDTVADALSRTLSFARDNNEDYLRYANQASTAVVNAAKDIGEIVGVQGSENRSFADGLVSKVLQQARSSDERNIMEFLGTSKFIIGVAAAALVAIFVVPRFAKGGARA